MDKSKGVHVKAKRIPKPLSRFSQSDRVLARLCYYYPQYTFAQARKLPAKRVKLLLEEAVKIKAEDMFQLTNIAAAPKTKKMKGVKDLQAQFKRIGGF